MKDIEFVTLNPAEIGHQLAYQILAATVIPRPIALVSTQSRGGIPNLAPFSFFQAGGSNPPSVVFSPTTGRAGGSKDTLTNVLETGEFVINLVTFDMAQEMNRTSAALSSDLSEWDCTTFHRLPSTKVTPARIAESPVHFECRLFSHVKHGDGPGSANYLVGEVVAMHLWDSLQKDGVIETDRLEMVGRMGGEWYIETSQPQRFRMKRPSAP